MFGLIVIVLTLLGMAARAAWVTWPGLATCALFWATAFLLVALLIRAKTGAYRWLQALALVGLVLNATVTIANGGYMPVSDYTGPGTSVWVAESDQHVLTWLGDNYAGASIGDLVLAVGVLGQVIVWLGERVARGLEWLLEPEGAR